MAQLTIKELEARYELGEVMSEGTHFRVYRGTEISVGTPCVVHRVAFREAHTDGDEQLALTVLRQYARVSLPRAPRLVDAWVASDQVVTVEYRWEAPPLGSQAAAIRSMGPRERGGLLGRTLYHVAGLHASNLLHRHLTPDCWGMDSRGKVYFLDLGIEHALIKALHEARDNFSLAGNLEARDLADWAHGFLSLLLGEPVSSTPKDDPWDEVDFRDVDRKLTPLFSQMSARAFFIDALSGFAVGTPRFGTAREAWKYWEEQKLGEKCQ